jgi:hypothetical protein
MINIVMAGSTGIFQLLNMETVRDRNIIWIQIRRSSLDSKNTGVTADAIWINVVKLGGETCMLFPTSQWKNIDARHQGMARRMTLRTVNFGMHCGLFPKRRFPLLRMASETEFLVSRGIGG